MGIPGVFFPLDTCGRILHRRGMTLKVRLSSAIMCNMQLSTSYLDLNIGNQNENKKQRDREFVVSVYTKSAAENPERGLVIKLYDRGSSHNAGE